MLRNIPDSAENAANSANAALFLVHIPQFVPIGGIDGIGSDGIQMPMGFIIVVVAAAAPVKRRKARLAMLRR